MTPLMGLLFLPNFKRSFRAQLLTAFPNYLFLVVGLVFPEGHEVGKIGVLETRERYVYYLVRETSM